MFERTLQDLIRGLRAHKASSKAAEEAFIQEALTEVREELKGNDMALKAEGVLKVCYVSVCTALSGHDGGLTMSAIDVVPYTPAFGLRFPRS